MRQQCTFVTKKENDVLAALERVLPASWEEILLLIYSGLVRISLVYSVQFCSPQDSRAMNILQRVHSSVDTSMEGSLGYLRDWNTFAMRKG